MERRERSVRRDGDTVNRIAVSRRAALGSSSAAILGLLTGSVLGGESSNRQERDAATQARLDQRKAFADRMRNAGSMEERIKMMEEMRAMDRQRAVTGFQARLGLSDPEWTVVKPRIEAVYDLVHPDVGTRTDGRHRSEVEQRSTELREILNNSGADANQIRNKLAALRTAKERAKQELAEARKNLCQIMTVRQEAVLVLHGLLD